MDIRNFIKQTSKSQQVTRVIDHNGKVIREHFSDEGGISIDFISAKWALKSGQIN